MNVTIGSLFRNSGNFVVRYCNQVLQLKKSRPDLNLSMLALEGDSWDHTNGMLRASAPVPLTLLEHSHGFAPFGSTESPDRFREMSKIGNMVFDAVPADCDVFVFVESDLIWEPHVMGIMIDQAYIQDSGFDIFAAMPFAGEHFYDVWGFRGMDGARWSPFAPYHSERNEHGYTEVSSAGSCLAMRGEVARDVRVINDMCFVGWCEDARNKGYRIASHSSFKVTHPC